MNERECNFCTLIRLVQDAQKRGATLSFRSGAFGMVSIAASDCDEPYGAFGHDCSVWMFNDTKPALCDAATTSAARPSNLKETCTMADHDEPDLDFGTFTPGPPPTPTAINPPAERFSSTQETFPVQLMSSGTQYGVIDVDRLADVPVEGDCLHINGQLWRVFNRNITYKKVETGIDLTTIDFVHLTLER